MRCDRALVAIALATAGCTFPGKPAMTARPSTPVVTAPSLPPARTTVNAFDVVEIGGIGPLRMDMTSDELPRVLGAALSPEIQSRIVGYGCSLRSADWDEVDDIALLLEGSAQRRVIAMFSSERNIAFGIHRGDSQRHVLDILKQESLTVRLDRDPYGAEDELGSIVIATRIPSPRVDTPALAIFFEDGQVARAAAGYAGWLTMQPEAQVENCGPES
jgi:hypothetical protein